MFKSYSISKDRILEFVVDIREADRKEVYRTTGLTSLEAIEDSVNQSKESFIVYYKDKPLVVCGYIVPSLFSYTAHPWMLTTNEIEKHKKEFLKKSKEFIGYLLEDYSLLLNYVDAEYEDSIKWLKWLGFTILPAVPYGPKGDLFHPFIKVRKDK